MLKFVQFRKPYLLIHYDIADDKVRGKVRTYKGVKRLTQSVDILFGSTDEAEKLWADVAKETKGLWMKEDRLVINFVGGDWAGMIWSEHFTQDGSSLESDPTGKFMAYMLEELDKAVKG